MSGVAGATDVVVAEADATVEAFDRIAAATVESTAITATKSTQEEVLGGEVLGSDLATPTSLEATGSGAAAGFLR